MTLLRNPLIILVVSLLLLGGYAHQVLARCEAPTQQSVKEPTRLPQHQPAGHAGDNCQCLCHKVIAHEAAFVVRVPTANLSAESTLLPRSERPPLTDPDGIDHPPQLA